MVIWNISQNEMLGFTVLVVGFGTDGVALVKIRSKWAQKIC